MVHGTRTPVASGLPEDRPARAGMLSAVERCIDEIARRGPSGSTCRGARRRQGGLLPHPEARPRRVPDRVARADADAEADQAGDARRPHREGGLVRPGPIIGGAVHPYIEHRKALRATELKVPYKHPSLEPSCGHARHDRLQDQARVAMAFAGFSGGRPGLRRAMSGGAQRRRSAPTGEVPGRRGRARASPEPALTVWNQIVGFSGCGFQGALAASGARLPVHLAARALPPEFLWRS